MSIRYLRYLVLTWLLVALSQIPLSFAGFDPANAKPAAVWTFDGGNAKDSSGKNINGNFVGKPKAVGGIVKKALKFNGSKDGIRFPDSADINTGGPYTNRTVVAFFNCDDVDVKDHKQTIFEEGGKTRGLVIYVYDGKAYVGGWNRAEYNWPGAWPSVKVESKKWYHLGLVIRDAKDKVEKGKFEMWVNGSLVAKEKGGQLHAHGDDIGVGYVNQNAVFHDEKGGAGSDVDHFAGLIDEVGVYGKALVAADFQDLTTALSVDHNDKVAVTWGKIKSLK